MSILRAPRIAITLSGYAPTCPLSGSSIRRAQLNPTLEIDLRVGGAYHLPGPDEEARISGTVLERPGC